MTDKSTLHSTQTEAAVNMTKITHQLELRSAN